MFHSGAGSRCTLNAQHADYQNVQQERSVTRHPVVSLSLVVPVFNESESIGLFLRAVRQVFDACPSIKYELVFVNDGSTDDTLDSLLVAQGEDLRIRIIELSRNFGKEAALSAGLEAATGDVIVPLDVDLQDPPELILDMIVLWRQGFDVVLAHRQDRRSDSWAKRMSAILFYRIHNRIADPQLPENVGDFRLMDRSVVEALKQLPESRRFMKGLFAWVGFRTTAVNYVRPERQAGSSKFNGWALWNFALEGMTSFSTEPLRIWTYLGIFVSFMAFIYGLFIIARVVVLGIDVPGYASLMVALSFLGGVQLIGIGIIGEYLGRTYIESKRRPVYIVRNIFERKD
ncbi:glycosyltransferase family 2 protein [Thiohalocapsa marina]|uniref:Glycosyltransferase family 2 protein n=2 Tax=Thiohalocapsa marina TaxID=424902 RepID=A0A5M8FUI2_9GAMM|nr:glycosyltransferase family 2 protein [Thiohalocapsa marina]